MTRLALAACFVSCCVSLSHGQTEVAAATEFTSLSNGIDLDGWEGDPRLWSVKDGVIHGETTEENKAEGNTFLIWKDPVRDFELRLSFRCNTANNSGIQYRSRRVTEGERARNPWVVVGYQYEIRNEDTLPDVPGFIYDEGGQRGRICFVGEKATWEADGKQIARVRLISAEEFKSLMKIDDWNDVVIIAQGNHIQHYLNGRLILDFIDNHPQLALRDGVLALQLHAGKPMWAEFKDIRLKTIN